MAANLVKAGHAVVGYDLSAASLAAAKEAGVATEPSAIAAVRDADADIVVTMLPAGKHVRAVWAELLPVAKQGALFIDCSTIDVESARAVHDLAAKAGVASLDAPVSGGTGGARPPLSPSWREEATRPSRRRGRSSRPWAARSCIAGAGRGTGRQDLQHMILGVSMIAVGEAFALAEKLGLSHQALFDVASTSSGQCWSLTTYCPVPGPVPTSPANNGYKPGFAADLMLKDLKLSQEAAGAAGAATPLGASAAQLYALFQAAGHGGDDFSAIINFIRGMKG